MRKTSSRIPIGRGNGLKIRKVWVQIPSGASSRFIPPLSEGDVEQFCAAFFAPLAQSVRARIVSCRRHLQQISLLFGSRDVGSSPTWRIYGTNSIPHLHKVCRVKPPIWVNFCRAKCPERKIKMYNFRFIDKKTGKLWVETAADFRAAKVKIFKTLGIKSNVFVTRERMNTYVIER